MKKKEKMTIAGMTVEELKAALAEVDNKLTQMTINQGRGQIRNTREARALRQKKAVMLTVLKEKELTHE